MWSRTLPMTRGQCFVEEGKATARGTLNGDDTFEFSVKANSNGSFEAQILSNDMNWVAGVRDGSELSIDSDVSSQTISGAGLFYNMYTDEWAYGSFQFECTEG